MVNEQVILHKPTPKPKDDHQIQELWPGRIEADLRIRRMRLIDISKVMTDEEWAALSTIRLDYITMSNLAVYIILHGVNHFKQLRSTGIFNSWQTFTDIAKNVSSYTKRLNTPLQTKQKYAELGTLTGYQQLPYPGFNYDEEVQALADGGEEHGDKDWKNTFSQALKKIDNGSYYDAKPYITFEEYITNGEWLTSGSSSIGHVHWEMDSKTGHFKARKNMLLELYTPQQIIDLVNNWDGVLYSKAIIKNELGKVRIAVASNLEAYLTESYLVRLTGHIYKGWEGITLDENPNEYIKRAKDTQKLLSQGAFCLPFDYAGFDRQPQTWEVQKIVSYYANHNASNVPPQDRSRITAMLSKTLKSYSHSVLLGTNAGKTKEYTVEGGVPSGVRLTSLVGNVWNAVMTRIARDRVKAILGYDPVLQVSLRGDDSLIVCKTGIECYMVRLAYQSINAIGNNLKFGITQSEGEFLRSVYTPTKVTGWVNRAIPSITQRKPWNPEPWTPNSEPKILHDNIDLMMRRIGLKDSRLHHAAKMKWSHYVHQSYKWLELPVRLGGFGLYEWDGWVPDRRLPSAQKPSIVVKEELIATAPTWIELTATEVAQLAQTKMTSKMVADDIPGIQTTLTRKLKDKYKKTEITWEQHKVTTYKLPFNNITLAIGPTKIPKFHAKVDTQSTTNFPHLTQFLREYNEVANIKTIPTLSTYLPENYPSVWEMVSQLEKQGWHRTDAINLTLGKIPTEPTQNINPTLTPYVQQYLEDAGAYKWRGRETIGRKLAYYTRVACDLVFSSPISNLFAF